MSALASERTEKRATQFLRAAREIFLTEGWDHFSVESIADFAECSRPLVYRHFSCKEEILLALAIESKRRRVRLCERALAFLGRPRERMLAIGEVEGLLLPRDLPIELFVASTNLRAKTSRQRQEELKVMDVRSVSMSASVIREAVNVRDLTLPDGIGAEDLLFFMWASRWGAANIMRSDTPLRHAGVTQAAKSVELSLSLMMDGFGWRPLSAEWDYKDTRKRVHRDAFSAEVVGKILNE